MMPSVLRYNRPATERAQKSIAGALRAPELDASDAFAAFIGKLGLPRTLSQVGVGEEPVPADWRKRHAFDLYPLQSAAHSRTGRCGADSEACGLIWAPSAPANQRKLLRFWAIATKKRLFNGKSCDGP
jgi:hypothetical protein